MRTTEKGTFQMLWDCPNCGAEKLLGIDHRHCPACGSPQDPARRYFPKDEDKIAVEDHAYAGADVVCPACETPNSAKAEFCVGCGSPLTEAAKVRVRGDQVAGEGAAFGADSAKAASDEHKAAKKAERDAKMAEMSGAPAPAAAAGGGKSRIVLFALLALGFLGCVCGGVAVFWKKDAAMTVTGHSWERAIAVEEYKTVTESAWDEEVPAGARNVSCRREQRGTEQVADGETCSTRRKDNGDGTFSESEECKTKYRSEPTYDDKCSYTVDKWVESGKERETGKSLDEAPTWPKVRTSSTRREGARTETYTVHLKESEGGDAHTCSTTEKKWRSFKKGQKVKGAVGVVTGAVDCDDLQPLK